MKVQTTKVKFCRSTFYSLKTVTCCESIEVTSDETIAGGHNDYLLGNYTYTSGDDINGRPVYRGAWYQYETHLSMSPTWYFWAGNINSDPGTGYGYMISQEIISFMISSAA